MQVFGDTDVVTNTGAVPYACLSPPFLLDAACSLMIEDQSQPTSVDVGALWPANDRPDASDLVRALNDIPCKGIIKETLLPIIWQVSILYVKLRFYVEFSTSVAIDLFFLTLLLYFSF